MSASVPPSQDRRGTSPWIAAAGGIAAGGGLGAILGHGPGRIDPSEVWQYGAALLVVLVVVVGLNGVTRLIDAAIRAMERMVRGLDEAHDRITTESKDTRHDIKNALMGVVDEVQASEERILVVIREGRDRMPTVPGG